MRCWIGLVVALALIAGHARSVAAERVMLPIPPGYTPELNSDERGLWMEMTEYEQRVIKSPLLVRDPQLNRYVKDVACRVAGPYCEDIRVYIMRNPGFNASMAPNGMMQVWTGLLIRVYSEDELSSILGHELAHYAMGHTLDQFRRFRTSSGLGAVLSLGLGMATGVLAPVGEMLAVADAMAFSRSQETEADLVGLQFMVDAGFNPAASYRVWDNLLAEEDAAAIKREAPNFFLRTHPDVERRAAELRNRVLQLDMDEPAGPPIGESHREAMSALYVRYMEDQIDTNRYGRTEFLLHKHAELGISRGYIEFFRGEVFRQRAHPGDTELAEQAYLAAAATDNAPPEVYRNLGYLALKRDDTETMKQMFEQYLTLEPEASDRAMIEFYLED